MIVWLHSKTDPELKVSAVVRNLIRDKMSLESRKKPMILIIDSMSLILIPIKIIPFKILFLINYD